MLEAGYNAALIAELAGPDGQVTTVDIDAEVTARARLDAAGTANGREACCGVAGSIGL